MTRMHTLRDPAAVLPWLQQIVRNCALMQQRRQRHEVILSDLDNTDTSPGPEQLLDDHALRDPARATSPPGPRCCHRRAWSARPGNNSLIAVDGRYLSRRDHRRLVDQPAANQLTLAERAIREADPADERTGHPLGSACR
jgi:DNA-directed RNA polymerase specialized sigma24 family protein